MYFVSLGERRRDLTVQNFMTRKCKTLKVHFPAQVVDLVLTSFSYSFEEAFPPFPCRVTHPLILGRKSPELLSETVEKDKEKETKEKLFQIFMT